ERAVARPGQEAGAQEAPVIRRALVALAAGSIASVLVTAPADAHTVTGVRPTNYRSDILAMLPRLPGVTVRLLDLGNRVELSNGSGTDVVVLGYFGEPYLRVGPHGVFENTRSQSVAMNRVTAT